MSHDHDHDEHHSESEDETTKLLREQRRPYRRSLCYLILFIGFISFILVVAAERQAQTALLKPGISNPKTCTGLLYQGPPVLSENATALVEDPLLLISNATFVTASISTTASVLVQRALSLYMAFHFDEARRLFRQAQQYEPSLMIAYVGEALTHQKLIWNSIEMSRGREVLTRWVNDVVKRRVLVGDLGVCATTQEVALVRATYRLLRFTDDPLVNVSALVSPGATLDIDGFAQEMATIYATAPDDTITRSFS